MCEMIEYMRKDIVYFLVRIDMIKSRKVNQYEQCYRLLDVRYKYMYSTQI
jgi:hypothetical protein